MVGLTRLWTGSPLTAAVTLAAVVFLAGPLAIVALFSFHATASLAFPFTGFSLRWYREIFASPAFLTAIVNSLIVASAAALSTFVLGFMAAYGLSRTASRWRIPLALLFYLPITLPGLLLGLALLVFFAGIEFKLSLLTVTIGHFIYVFPYFLLIVKTALDRMDPAMEEAAADLGAGPWAVFRRVTLPQIRPVVMGATSLAFALSFDEFVITFFIIGSQSTLPLYIWSSMRRTIDPSINTVSTLLLATTLILFALSFILALRKQHEASQPAPAGLPS
jgi:ABC-type spermidine/putrescine transport system permease subunit II